MTPEAKVKKKVRDLLKKHGAYYVTPATGGYGRSGAPDFIACIRGSFLGVECKAGKGKTTELQDAAIEQIHRAGGRALVVNEENLYKLDEFLAAVF